MEFGNKSINLNSDKDKEIITNSNLNVTPKKVSEFAKFKKNFFAEDGRGVLATVWSSVVLPNLKKLFVDSVSSAANTAMYGKGKNPNGNKFTNSLGNVAYGAMFNKPSYAQEARNTIYDVDEYIWNTALDAQAILDTMVECIKQYGYVSVNDYYDIIKVKGNNPQDVNYGWKDLSSARIKAEGGGYKIQFPRIMPLK